MGLFTGFAALAALILLGSVSCEDETIGPIFMKEPPNRVDFSNTTGAVVECAARGSPAPDVIWVRADGTAVGDVPGLRQVLPNGNLVFPPFRAEDYRQEVHAQVYACLARNPVGTIHSRDVNVRAVVSQAYDVKFWEEYVLRGNAVILKCQIPSFVSEYVSVNSWIISEDEDAQEIKIDESSNLVVSQAYAVNLMEEYVLRGNAAILKCHIPSFVSEYVTVISWIISEDNEVVEIKLDSAHNLDEGKYLVLPSGELHIRDVGPEDGYKSYQCRTKHRLTGETRLSATKGRLVITEPTNKISPRKDSTKLFEGWEVFFVPRNNVAYMTCQVSAFPSPLFRWYKFIDGSTRKQPVTLNDRVKQVSGTLIIKEAKVEDSGKYLCVVNNSVGGESVETVLTVTAPLKAAVEPATQTVDFGRPAVFTCKYEGNPIKTVTWLKDGKDMNHHDAVLRIESVKKEDKGMYQCFIRNDQESAGASAELKLGGRFEPPQIRHSFGEQTLRSGPSLRLKCVASGNPTPDITWFLDGDKLSSGERLQIGQFVTADGNVESHLNISSVQTNDGGLYSCVALSKVGSASHSARVNVYGLPYIRPMKKRPVVAGDTLIAHCPVAGYPIDSIIWERDGRNLPINRKQKVFPNGTLVIENVERISDQATYTCVAKNSQGYSVKGNLELQVMVVPHIIPFEVEESIFAGESVHLTCHVSKGDRPLQISWRFQGKEIPYHNSMGITTTKLGEKASVLSIPTAMGQHSGNYTCTASNRAGRVHHSALVNIHVVPHIKPFELDEAVFAGESVHLDCHVSKGDTPLNISWSFQGKPITSRMGSKIMILSERVSVLDIPNALGQNSGNYTCTASNRAGTISHTALLNVIVPPNILPFKFGEKPANVGEYLQAACTINLGDLPLTITWMVNGQPISQRNNNYVINNSKRSSLLIIESVDAKHAGSYMCIGKNRAGSTTYSEDLVVYVPPLIVPFSFGEMPYNPGDTVVVNCVATKGDLPLDISWTFSSETLDSSLHRDIMTMQLGPRASALTINPVSANHQGNYTCIVQNAAGRVEYAATLVVNVPPRWILEPTDKAFAQGSDAKVECKADGFPKPQVTWKRAEGDTPGDYKDLKPNNPNVKVEDGALTIDNIQKTNEGYYLCEAVNGIGSGLSAVILISVQAPPQFEIKMRNQTARRSEPAVLQCQAKGEKPIGIIWNMNNKRLEPKLDPRYTIREEILSGGVVSDLSIRRTERSDSALFTCVATNTFGSDDTSINMIIQEVPEAPYGLKVLDKSGRTVQLSWAAPYDGNSPIKKFLIEYKRAKGTWEKDIDRVLVPGDATEAGVFSLRPATAYHIRIVAENELGTSEPSETVTIITAEEAPSGPPQDVKVDAVDRHILRVTWKPPPPQDWNGELQGYYVGYKLASSNKSFVFETVDISKESGKEHHLDISNLKTYTQYAMVVQAFNKMGSGPVSTEVKAYTAEGAPSAPPQDVFCTTLTAQTIRVSWVSPPLTAANGLIKAYKVIYGPSGTWYDEKTKDTKITASSETILHGLKKYTNYSMEVLATTNGGDGVRSTPIHCQTEQDVPEAPRAVKALVMGPDSILVSWRPPAQPNGVVTHYNVYTQAQNAEPHPNKVPASQTSYSATDLKAGRYDFWVTASTIIGEGQSSATASCSPSDKVPAKIASFDESFIATYKEDVKLPCLAVGVPPPNILWKVKGQPLETLERIRQLPEGSLQIAGVAREDAGEYSCHVDNQFGTDTVTHTLSILAPPFPPQLTIAASSVSSLTLRLKPSDEAEQSPAAGYSIHYKQEFGDWETVQIPSHTDTYTLENLFCGSKYQLYVTAYNGIGTGEASDVVFAGTRGSKPPVPRATDFIEVGSSSVTLHLKQWLDGGCPMSHFVVENKKKGTAEWNQISNAVKPGGNFVVLDLEAATWYTLRITAHNNAGFNVAEYDFATLTMTGGTIAPLPNNVDGGKDLPVWVKAWLEPEVLVPILATIVVFIVGVVVICLTLARRNAPHRLRDDAVYNASQAAMGGGGGTLDKRGGLRDELGYIAPPNRKLPPVPGSNYNTCDRVKRQAVIMGAHSTWDPRRHHYERVRRPRMRRTGSGDTISTGMEDEICPYATFHLLGFREEMDPSKALAFPHHHAAHAGTLAHPHPHHPAHSRAGSQSMPRANSRYARKNSQGGQSAIYSTAPEYDDPATCAEEDQYRARYSRPMYACGPEYDEPACCAPEDEQYAGAYGTPYSDHYGSRPSIGTRKCGGSPEPPPPPPRNVNNDNNCSSSFNESKDSNEISEAECDQPRNYPVRAHTAKDGMHSEEMRKLIDRPEAATPIPQQAIHGRGGLTAYDTVAV
ncbi:cell adhesion molecule DSCAM isoform X2 [Achroia grisella]|uniref:cell adhesion molecule DSCAM isoform X2 n=1 Tax=Achroia grisella TaxID=688607 RepID=UPI0027D346F7|nr:cell adhesion molecule DSCAM isoform X2 [Achroia grisella]